MSAWPAISVLVLVIGPPLAYCLIAVYGIAVKPGDRSKSATVLVFLFGACLLSGFAGVAINTMIQG